MSGENHTPVWIEDGDARWLRVSVECCRAGSATAHLGIESRLTPRHVFIPSGALSEDLARALGLSSRDLDELDRECGSETPIADYSLFRDDWIERPLQVGQDVFVAAEESAASSPSLGCVLRLNPDSVSVETVRGRLDVLSHRACAVLERAPTEWS